MIKYVCTLKLFFSQQLFKRE